MTTEERNKWILENNEKIVECLTGYCERNPELVYEELYQDTILYLIDYLDSNGEPCGYLKTFLGNYVRKIVRNKKEGKEIPVDFFELVFLQDFDFESSAIVKALVKRAKIDDDEYRLNLIRDIAVDGSTFYEASGKYGKSKARIRKDYLDALMRLRMAAVYMKLRKD